MKKFLHTIEKLIGVYRWHPKIALRYLPIVDYIIQNKIGAGEVLEVGSGGLGITPYLKKKVVGLDVVFAPPYHELLMPVKGSITAIPFSDQSFGAVVCTDVLEHIRPQDREKSIEELIRVGEKIVCIGVPCGVQAQLQDEQLETLYRKNHGTGYHFLDEQVEYGLPHEKELINWTKKAAEKFGRSYTLVVTGNINLKLRKWLMIGWMTKSPAVNFFFRKIMLIAVPLLRLCNWEPTYRKIVVVSFK